MPLLNSCSQPHSGLFIFWCRQSLLFLFLLSSLLHSLFLTFLSFSLFFFLLSFHFLSLLPFPPPMWFWNVERNLPQQESGIFPPYSQLSTQTLWCYQWFAANTVTRASLGWSINLKVLHPMAQYKLVQLQMISAHTQYQFPFSTLSLDPISVISCQVSCHISYPMIFYMIPRRIISILQRTSTSLMSIYMREATCTPGQFNL